MVGQAMRMVVEEVRNERHGRAPRMEEGVQTTAPVAAAAVSSAPPTPAVSPAPESPPVRVRRGGPPPMRYIDEDEEEEGGGGARPAPADNEKTELEPDSGEEEPVEGDSA